MGWLGGGGGHVDDLVQDFIISSALAMEILHSEIEP